MSASGSPPELICVLEQTPRDYSAWAETVLSAMEVPPSAVGVIDFLVANCPRHGNHTMVARRRTSEAPLEFTAQDL
jgi:hypothetical protein